MDDGFITLELTKEETKALYILLQNVGGSPDTSLRRATDEILNSMRKAFQGGDITNWGLYDEVEIEKTLGITEISNYTHPRYSSFYFQDGAV